MVTRHRARLSLRIELCTDDEARVFLERWVKVTGRKIDWASVWISHDARKTTIHLVQV